MAIKRYIFALNVDKAIFHVFLWWMPLPQRFLSSKTVLIDQSTSQPLDAIGRSFTTDVIEHPMSFASRQKQREALAMIFGVQKFINTCRADQWH